MATSNPSITKGGNYAGTFASYLILDSNVRSLLSNEYWTSDAAGTTAATQFTYFFPTQASQYPANYMDPSGLAAFKPATSYQQTAARIGFDLITSYTGVTFDLSLTPDASIRIAGATSLPGNEGGSHASYPYNHEGAISNSAGDVYLGDNGDPKTAQLYGNDTFATIIHEMGHALGLKHPFEVYPNGPISAARNDIEFTVMTYSSFLSGEVGVNANTIAPNGSSVSGYMMYDIAALQEMYGANFSKGKTDNRPADRDTYTWSETTGQQYINGQPAPDTGTTQTNKIFTTVWTKGAATTYDLSNFNSDQYDDLRPGQWLRFSPDQLADLNDAAPAGTPEYQAQGNVYNTLLYHGDTRSEIGTLMAGAGNDTIIGNDLANTLWGNDGNDSIDGGVGNDILYGGNGDDILTGGFGYQNQLWGDAGIDTASYAARTGVVYADLTAGYAKVDYFAADTFHSIENLTGGSGPNTLIGDSGANQLTGGAGDDQLYGFAGADHLVGGLGNDMLNGGIGADSLLGGDGNDSLLIDAADTTIDGGAGYDSALVQTAAAVTLNMATSSIEWARGNDGNDVFNAGAQTSAVYIYGQDGNDTLTGSAFGDYLDGGVGDDTLVGGDGNDTLFGNTGADIMRGQGGDDTLIELGGDSLIDGGTGFDSLYVWSNTGLTLNLTTASIEWVQGSVLGGDNLDGSGNTVNSFLYGWGGNDVLKGGWADDYIAGGDGNDFLTGGAGNDTLIGEAGINYYVYTAATWGADTVHSFHLNADKLDFTTVASIHSFSDFTTHEWDAGNLGYNSTTLFYADGSTTSAITLIGIQVASLSDSDFLFV